MAKKRVNWTIEGDAINLLKQAEKIQGQKTSRSKLVEYAIRNTFKNKADMIREKMRYHQQKLMEYNDKLDEIQGAKDATSY